MNFWEIKSIKQDTTILKREDYISDDIFLKKSIGIDNDLQARINYSINQIMTNSDLDILRNDFTFLISYLKENDFIFPPEFIQRLLFFLTDQNSQEKQVVLKLLRFITSFNSVMQQFLIDNGLFEIMSKYFPNEEVINTFANLSCGNSDARSYLLNSGIIDFISSNINDNEYFECLIHLLKNLLCHMNGFSYNKYIDQFTQLFRQIISNLNINDSFSSVLIVNAIRDYIDADEKFMDDFLLNDQLLIFLNSNFKEYEFLHPLLKICKIIIYQKKENGAQYLIDNNILHFISTVFFEEHQKNGNLCFNLLYLLVDFVPYIADNLINQDFHTIAVSEFNGESTLLYRENIYKFFCILLYNSSAKYLNELIEGGVIEILIENTSILEYEDDWNILLDGINKLINSADCEIVKEQIASIKDNEEFNDWLYEACNSQDPDTADIARGIEYILLRDEIEED